MPNPFEALKLVNAGPLDVAYAELGPNSGPPVFLMHGFPYDIHAYEAVAPLLAAQGCRVIVPYLRGFGRTRFLQRPRRARANKRRWAPTCWR